MVFNKKKNAIIVVLKYILSTTRRNSPNIAQIFSTPQITLDSVLHYTPSLDRINREFFFKQNITVTRHDIIKSFWWNKNKLPGLGCDGAKFGVRNYLCFRKQLVNYCLRRRFNPFMLHNFDEHSVGLNLNFIARIVSKQMSFSFPESSGFIRTYDYVFKTRDKYSRIVSHISIQNLIE